MIHARVIDSIPEENRGELTHALMGTTPNPTTPKRLEGARLPPVNVPVRTLPGMPLHRSMAELRAAIPSGPRRA